jgi:phosphate-selective porin
VRTFCVAIAVVSAGLTAHAQAPSTFGSATPAGAAVERAATGPSQASSNEKKQKKQKKKTSDVIAPDEPVEPDQRVAEVAEDRPRHFVWKQHPSIRYGKVFRLDFQAKLQEDAHTSYPGAKGVACPDTALPSTCLWELHRNRVGIEGYFFRRIEYEVERELTEQELTERELLAGYTPKSLWKNVDVNVSYIDNVQVQLGRFKIPFSLDELTGDSHNDFAYRSLGANNLAPSRDTGVMLHGRFFKRGLGYATGVFRHDGDNSRSKKIQGGGQTWAGRLTGMPLRRLNPAAFGGLEVGTAVAISSVSDDSFRPNGLRGRTLFNQDTFYEPVYVNGDRLRWEADVDWTIGPASMRSEFIRVTDQRRKQGLGDQDLADARARSWYVSGTWILTGEGKSRPVKAANEFMRSGFGALEAAARYERLWFDSVASDDSSTGFRSPRADSIFPRGEKALTLGLNWTVNRWSKLQFNVIRERVEDPESNPVPNGGSSWSRVLRFQFVL